MKYRIKTVARGNDVAYYVATSIRNGSKVNTICVKSLGRRQDIINKGIDVDKYLIDIVNEYNKDTEGSLSVLLNPGKKPKKGDTGDVEAGIIFIKRIFDDIKLNESLAKIQEKYKIKYSLSDVTLFHIANRIIHPDSKIAMFNNAIKNSLLKPEFFKDSVYRAMDVIEENRTEILKTCYKNLPFNVKRSKSILYYDCTNTYFESEVEDELRARGKGKRNETEPLVSMGLAMDASGIPLTFTVFKGSTNEQKTLIPLEKEIIRDFNQSKFVIVTDAGLSSNANRCFNSLNNRKYITTLPVRRMRKDKLDRFIFSNVKPWQNGTSQYKTPADITNRYDLLIDLKEAALDEGDTLSLARIESEIEELMDITLYRRFPVKEDKKPKEYLEKPSDSKNPDLAFIEEDYIISFSLRYALREKRARNKKIVKAINMIKDTKKINKYGANDPRQFISKTIVNDSTGEIFDERYELDNEVIEKQGLLDGYYCVCTNLQDDDNQTIIDAMRYRWKIEDSFRLMKQYFHFRSVNHSKPERIKSHFTMCFLSLLIYRYIQKMCHESKYESLKRITDKELIELMRSYRLTKIKKDYYVPGFDVTPEIEELELLMNTHLAREVITPAALNRDMRLKIRDLR